MQQLMLPLLLAMDATKKGLLSFVQQMGMVALSELLATEAALIAGPKGKHTDGMTVEGTVVECKASTTSRVETEIGTVLAHLSGRMLSVAAKFEGRRIKNNEGPARARLEGRVALFGLAQDVLHDAAVAAEARAQAFDAPEDVEGVTSDGRVLGRRRGVEHRVLDAESTFEHDEGGLGEIDDDELGGDEQAMEPPRGHSFARRLRAWAWGSGRRPRGTDSRRVGRARGRRRRRGARRRDS